MGKEYGEVKKVQLEVPPLIEPPAVYRQCSDISCPAYILELPHAHFESIEETEALIPRYQQRLAKLEDFKAQWNAASTGPATVLHDITGFNKLVPEWVPGTLEESPVTEWLSIPINESDWLMQKVGEYITWVETGLTVDVCKCTRVEYPNKPGAFFGERSLTCPAHAKEGLVLGFFTWLTTQPERPIPDTAMGDG